MGQHVIVFLKMLRKKPKLLHGERPGGLGTAEGGDLGGVGKETSGWASHTIPRPTKGALCGYGWCVVGGQGSG